ncbi:MAG: ornithine cyclodeaminase family protein [Actinomycetota bacterium]
MRTTRVLTQADVARIVADLGLDAAMDEMIARLATTFAAHDPELVHTMVRDGFRYTKPDLGLIEWMPTHVAGSSVSIKVVGYHPTNPIERRSPSVLSTTSLYDTTDGRMTALCDSSLLTAIRTGAASAVMTDVLAVPDARVLGMVGSGAQAVTQIHAISRVRQIEQVYAYDAIPGVAESLEPRLRSAGLDLVVEVVDDADLAVARADVLCTATSVDPDGGPVVGARDHRPWVHVNAVGADLPGKYELPLDLLRRSLVVPDVHDQCVLEGECQRLTPDEIGPAMPDVVRDRERHEAQRDRPTVFDSTGWALEDLIAAELALDHAERLGLGVTVELQPDPVDPFDPYELVRS